MKMPLDKNIILFDLDGTLTDPKVGITTSVQYALSHFGIHVENPDELCKFIGPPLRQAFKEYYGFDTAGAEEALWKYRERYIDEGIYENIMYPGIDHMLEGLKDLGKTLIVATSKPTILAEKVLKHFSLDKYFSFVSGAELNGERSEKSEIIQYAFEKCNIDNIKNCIMVGDRKHDIVGAKAACISSIGVLYGYGSEEELSEAGADYIVKTVSELSDLLYTS